MLPALLWGCCVSRFSGVHHKGKKCNSSDKVNHIEGLLNTNRAKLYPQTLTIAGYPRAPTKTPKPNGGWGDIRDHNLCESFTQDHMHKR